ncbi:MAG TPA: hypothetical protein VGP72_00375 [Planctomycetota bacterium]|jgi:hypothetical protein
MASSIVTFPALRKQLSALNISLQSVQPFLPSTESKRNREPWGHTKQREVTKIIQGARALLFQQDRLKALPFVDRFERLRQGQLGRADGKFKIAEHVAATLSQSEINQRCFEFVHAVGLLLDEMAESFPNAKLGAGPLPGTKPEWDVPGLPESLRKLAELLVQAGGAEESGKLQEQMNGRSPSDVVYKNRKRHQSWIEQYIDDSTQGVFRLKQQK